MRTLPHAMMPTRCSPKTSRSPCQVIGGLLLCAFLTQSVWCAAVTAADATPVAALSDPFADVAPGAMAAAERAVDELSFVSMDVTLDPAANAIGGDMVVTWRNTATEPLDEVWFRLFPNASYYGEGNLAVADITVNGAVVIPELALDDTALRVPLLHPVAPGETVEIAMVFTSVVPADSTGSYGIFTRDTGSGSWVLADWYPILAVYEEDAGWALPTVTPFGDPTYAPSAFYDVRLTAPDDLEIVTSGVGGDPIAAGGSVTRNFTAGPARDFVIVADDDFDALSQDVGETRVTLWTAPDLNPVSAERTLTVAADTLRYYNDWLGPYPTREVDLVQVDPAGALGIAWSGLLFLDGPALLETSAQSDPDGLASIVAHEVSHLWWGIMIGGDSNAHGFIQEGLATVSSLLYIEASRGPAAAADELAAWTIGPARRLLNAGDAIVDTPATEGQNESLRSAAIYGKGSLGFLAIRQQIGAEAFAAALRDIASRYAWGEMTPAQLRAAFERASGQDLAPLWSHWFDEAAMTKEEIDAIAAMFDR